MGRKKSTKRKSEILQVRVDGELARVFKHYCLEEDQSVSDMLRSMIEQLDFSRSDKLPKHSELDITPGELKDEKSEPIGFRPDF